MANYGGVCNKLEALMLELLDKGYTVPQSITDGLKSVRNLVLIYKQSPAELDLIMQNSVELQAAEMNLLIMAEANIGKEYADSWQQKIMAAYGENVSETPKISSYVSGVPKGDYPVRLKASDITIDGGIDNLIAELGLNSKPQSDGYILVYGAKEAVKALLDKIKAEFVAKNIQKQGN